MADSPDNPDTPPWDAEVAEREEGPSVAELEAAGATRVGISRDSVARQRQFDAEHELAYRLLSDADGTVASYAWAFGDTTTGSGRTTSRTYAAAGTYSVRLTVTDDDGATSSVTRSVVTRSRAATSSAGSFPSRCSASVPSSSE